MVKNKRIINREYLDYVKTLPCCVCNKPPPSDPCHIKSVGAGGGDIPDNIIPMCRLHHTESHTIGIVTFARKYDRFKYELFKKGWTFYSGKLTRF